MRLVAAMPFEAFIIITDNGDFPLETELPGGPDPHHQGRHKGIWFVPQFCGHQLDSLLRLG
jgi:hypothetical protein